MILWSFGDYLSISISLWIISHCLWRIIVFLGIINIVESITFFLDFQYSGIKKTDFDLSTFLSTIKPFSDCLLSSKRLLLKGRKSMIQTRKSSSINQSFNLCIESFYFWIDTDSLYSEDKSLSFNSPSKSFHNHWKMVDSHPLSSDRNTSFQRIPLLITGRYFPWAWV